MGRSGDADGLGDTRELVPAAGPAAGAAPPFPGRARVRQYELMREIGRGGMGTVYLARDTRLARRVAIKFLSHESPGFAERFLAEARATARCSHENIVVIHEVDELHGQPYMVLEYLDGRSLRSLLDGTPMSPGRAVELTVSVVRALAHAHGYGIVHRDLKPDNIFVTDDGAVKVLDFGIAKLFEETTGWPGPGPGDQADGDWSVTQHSALVGTLPYMSPEQWGADEVDPRTDLWAVGVILFELVAGHHPLAPVTRDRLLAMATRLDTPMPRLAGAVPDLPAELDAIVGRCLRKRKDERYPDAEALLSDLAPLVPVRRTTTRVESSPYPGLAAFREQDADLFYGREAEGARVAARLRDQPLIGVVGPSGAGKSSFVRAGVIPELKRGERWDAIATRPGRQPLETLAGSVLALIVGGEGRADPPSAAELTDRLPHEPGALGTLLRAAAHRRERHILLFVDQLEELFTLTDDDEARRAYLTCLLGAADDASSPVRVVISIRSDFLDRFAEQTEFIDALTAGLVFLAPPAPAGLRAALVEPAHAVDYRFETSRIVTEMVDQLAMAPGALPLLQFAVGRLWDERDRERRLLTEAVYQRIGGVTGAIASHADAVIAGFAPPTQRLARRILERLVTPERTRDMVELSELTALGPDPAAGRRVIDHLVEARLLVVRTEAGEPVVELVHDSLIARWPTLRDWLDRNQHDAAALARLRNAARQWSDAGRPDGLLWRDDAIREARRWPDQRGAELSRREREFLDAGFRVHHRAMRARRWLIAGAFSLLALLVVAAAIALVWIRDAEQDARRERDRAVAEAERARRARAELESANTHLAEEQKRQAKLLDDLRREQAERERARSDADVAARQVLAGRSDLERANRALRRALLRAEAESARARTEAERALAAQQSADQARDVAEELARKERERADRLEQQRGKISTRLK